MKKVSLLFTSSNDVHADRILAHGTPNVGFIRLDMDNPDWRMSFNNGDVHLTKQGMTYDLDDIVSVFVRRTPNSDGFRVAVPESIKDFADYIAQQEFFLFSDCLAILDSTSIFVNPLASASRAGKGVQARLASSIGFVTPKTYIGSDPMAARAFCERVIAAGHMACTKPILNTKVTIGGQPYTHFTTVVRPEMLDQLDSLSCCPTIFQEYVPKAYEVRATVVGDQVFAAKIESQAAGGDTSIDWRRYNIPKTPHYPIELPAGIVRKILALQERLGLIYSAFDLICTPTGEFVFLETNPFGQWLWIEDLTGLPISKAISTYLTTV